MAATKAHCLVCFEALAGSLENRPALPLKQVQELWHKYEISQEIDDEAVDDDQIGAGSAGMDEEMVDADDADEVPPESLKPLAVRKLLTVPSPSSGFSSSSVPSSAMSSSSALSSSRASGTSSRTSADIITGAVPREEDMPLFVTWNTLSKSGHKSLRGCIGTFEAQKLDFGLRSYALTSAFDDVRFSPITLAELPRLECGVTLLHDFETCREPMAWDLGTHGIRISFTHHGRRYGATYLPDVAVEQGWTKEETMLSLMRKAGWSGRRDDWRRVADLKTVRYQGSKATVSYQEWREWRDWLEEEGLA